jgi:hypothetical protein
MGAWPPRARRLPAAPCLPRAARCRLPVTRRARALRGALDLTLPTRPCCCPPPPAPPSYGSLLMAAAEAIAAREHGNTKVAVISGVGTR